jgi:hypothetical protein
MTQVKAYDKAKWHDETVAKCGLPEANACHHFAFFFRWLVDRDLLSEWMHSEFPDEIPAIRSGQLSVVTFIETQLDGCFISDMPNDEGNAFTDTYFDYQHGRYLSDLIDTLKGSLPSEYHIPVNDETYGRLKPIIDERYAAWKAGDLASVAAPPRPKRWWQFWK